MRILMLNNEFPPLGGGTGTVNLALLKRFARVPELEIDLITSALGRTEEREQFAERVQIFKVPVNNQNIHHSSNRELLTYAARALPLARRKHRKRPYDFCFAWSGVPAGGVALALQRMTGLRYLVRVCGPDIPGFEKRYRAIYPFLSPVIRAIWRGAVIVVAKCEGEAKMIHLVDQDVKTSIIPNGVDAQAFQPGDSVPDEGPLNLICVARLIERKGQHYLIEAIKNLADEGVEVTLDLIGTGDERQSYEAHVKSLNLSEQVRFLGYVPRERMAAHYASAHVFVLPSFNEGMSVSTLEAMAAGLPVVVTRTGGTAELVEDQVNGLTFDWADVKRLTAHLRRLAADRQLLQRMGAASRVRAEYYSWDATTERYLEMFDVLGINGVIQVNAGTRLKERQL